MLEHGGNLLKASQRYGIAPQQWLDLSTGINPNGWPVPDSLPSAIWSQLPQDDDGLVNAARQYYQCESLLAVAGSQAAIQGLPQLRPRSRVGVLAPGYAEHAHAWQQAGHAVRPLAPSEVDDALADLDVLVVINPNNPTGQRFEPGQLLDWHKKLSTHGGWLIVDEAFMDVTPEYSLSHLCPKAGLIVLRSVGKFFGLAGLRTGFVLAEASLLTGLAERLGPWPIAHASRYLTRLALEDSDWQHRTRQQLSHQGQALAKLLTDAGLSPVGSCSLFQWVQTAYAEQWHHQLAEQGIFTRLFEQPASLRFGLPPAKSDWLRLQSALQTLTPAGTP